MKRSPRRLRMSAPHLAGWLFADLLLVLFLASLALPEPEIQVRKQEWPRQLSQSYCELKVVVDLYGVQSRKPAAQQALLRGLGKALTGNDPDAIVNTDVTGTRQDSDAQNRCRNLLKAGAQKRRLKAGVIIVSGAESESRMGQAIDAAAVAAKYVSGPEGVPAFRAARVLAKWTSPFEEGVGLKFIVFFFEP